MICEDGATVETWSSNTTYPSGKFITWSRNPTGTVTFLESGRYMIICTNGPVLIYADKAVNDTWSMVSSGSTLSVQTTIIKLS